MARMSFDCSLAARLVRDIATRYISRLENKTRDIAAHTEMDRAHVTHALASDGARPSHADCGSRRPAIARRRHDRGRPSDCGEHTAVHGRAPGTAGAMFKCFGAAHSLEGAVCWQMKHNGCSRRRNIGRRAPGTAACDDRLRAQAQGSRLNFEFRVRDQRRARY